MTHYIDFNFEFNKICRLRQFLPRMNAYYTAHKYKQKQRLTSLFLLIFNYLGSVLAQAWAWARFLLLTFFTQLFEGYLEKAHLNDLVKLASLKALGFHLNCLMC